jgi:hypothetical protein
MPIPIKEQEMKIARLAGLALMAILAVSAVVASAAFAAGPEFKPSTKQVFNTTSGTSTLVGDNGAETVTCTADSSKGEITGAMSVGKVVVHFTGCKSTGSGGSGCTIKSINGAPAAGEIVTNTLKGELGTVKTTEAASGVALDLEPESGKIFTELEKTTCTKETKVTGSIAGEASPLNAKQTTGKLIFTTKSGKQAIAAVNLLGAVVMEPELVAYTSTATETTNEAITFTSAVEVT